MVAINFRDTRGLHSISERLVSNYGGTSCIEMVKAKKKGIKVPLIVDSENDTAKELYAAVCSKTVATLFVHLYPKEQYTPILFLMLYGGLFATLELGIIIVIKGRQIW
ncbi:MAG: hypothetical protein LBB43_02120 [Spirochaetaceae bacterium]|jgi:hypothetical protein|nr:hypothetical protein [Spirochaetaceae bacterium]